MELKFNCYLYDIGRGAYLKPEFFKKAMKLAADSGFTHFLPYLENMIKLPSMAKACPQCAYTAEQWRDFDKTAEKYGIELIPHFNVIGHTTQICEVYPELAGEKDGFEMDVTSKVARDWTIRCLKEYCSFSKGLYFQIGCDEWQAPNKLLAQDDFNVARAWADQVNMAVDYLVAQQRIPLVAYDMMVHYPETMKLLSKDAVIEFWFYDEDSDYPVVETLKKNGFRVVMLSGMCNGLLTSRRVRAMESLLASRERHKIDMFMMTSWSDGRWEKQSANIPLAGRIVKQSEVPKAIIETTSLFELVERNPGCVLNSGYIKKIKELLKDESWKKHQDYHDYFMNMLNSKYKPVLDSYKRYHYSEGPLYDAIVSLSNKVVTPESSILKSTPRKKKDSFELIVGKDAQKGEWVRFANNNESFEVYPKFGGILQNWQFGSEIIIPESVDARLKKGNMFAKGGYRSYSSIGGFRPIWALGTHHNPCILWQYPYSWKVITDSPEKKMIEMHRSFYHVDMRYRISTTRGTNGFAYTARAVNKLDFAYGAFNFNLPLFFSNEQIKSTSFLWTENQHLKSLAFTDVKDSFFVIPAKKVIRIKKQNYILSIDCGDTEGSGFYVDWSSTFITPDLHGTYKPLKKGAVTDAIWTFRID